MITRHLYGKTTWVDLESPSRDELTAVMDEFGIAAEIEEEIIAPTPYPLVVALPQYVYLILHFPTTDPKEGARNQEVDFIVGKHFLVTVRYEVIGSILNLHKAFEAEELLGLGERKVGEGPALLERVLRRLYGAMREEIEDVSRSLEKIERDIFSGKEQKTVRTISEVSRVLLRFETALVRHQEPLGTFLETLGTTPFFGKTFAAPSARIEGEREHVAALVGSYRAVTHELRSTNDSLLSTSQNETMKIFTVMSLATLPLALVAGLFGMHAKYAPILGTPHDFWIIIGIMTFVEALLLLFLRLKKWI